MKTIKRNPSVLNMKNSHNNKSLNKILNINKLEKIKINLIGKFISIWHLHRMHRKKIIAMKQLSIGKQFAGSLKDFNSFII